MGSLANRAAAVLSGISSIAIVLLGLITCADVLGRYFLHLPITGAHEILSMLMCLAIFPALPGLCLRRGHISVDLIDGVITTRARAVLLRVIDWICAVALAVVAYRMFFYGQKIRMYGDETLLLKIPLYPYVYLICLMAAVAALACLFARSGATDGDELA